jgi:ubiquinone/menaquinone biosynthesis C-methylase UbiE
LFDLRSAADVLKSVRGFAALSYASVEGSRMSSEFTVHNAAGYEQLMGRWSQKLAPGFIAFAGLRDGESILDVGCGTGSLTFALARAAKLKEISAIDYSPVFVDETIRRNTDPRIKVQQGDACALPFDTGTFDRALAMLVLHFVPEAGQAVAEMRRVVRAGGVVAATVWDHFGGMPAMRMMVDTVAVMSEAGRQLRHRYCFQPMMQPGEMKKTFVERGLADVTETQLVVRMDYLSFDDYWAPIAAGEGPLGKYVTTLGPAERARTEADVRGAYEAGRPDGPRSFGSIAWACRGIVP